MVVGFGGYPTVPPLLAASWRGVPTVLHEQNGVMGRANRMLASRVTRIATGFRTLKNVDAKVQAKIAFTGNPIRPAVLEAAKTPYAATEGELRLLVFGGSQGAHVMAEIVPPAIAQLAPEVRARLRIVQQARAEDLDAVKAVYAKLGVQAECAPFFNDMPARMASAHLIVSRSGASTVAELAAIGRPAIMVPLPHALDQDQFANAGLLAEAGGGIRLEQRDFTPQRLASEIEKLASEPVRARQAWRRRPNRPARSMPPSGSPTWCCRWPGFKHFGMAGLVPAIGVLQETMRWAARPALNVKDFQGRYG